MKFTYIFPSWSFYLVFYWNVAKVIQIGLIWCDVSISVCDYALWYLELSCLSKYRAIGWLFFRKPAQIYHVTYILSPGDTTIVGIQCWNRHAIREQWWHAPHSVLLEGNTWDIIIIHMTLFLCNKMYYLFDITISKFSIKKILIWCHHQSYNRRCHSLHGLIDVIILLKYITSHVCYAYITE